MGEGNAISVSPVQKGMFREIQNFVRIWCFIWVVESNVATLPYDSTEDTTSAIFPCDNKIHFSITKYIWHLTLWQHYAWQISLAKSYRFSYYWSCILWDIGYYRPQKAEEIFLSDTNLKRPTLRGQIVIYKLLETSLDCWIESQYHNAFTWKHFLVNFIFSSRYSARRKWGSVTIILSF